MCSLNRPSSLPLPSPSALNASVARLQVSVDGIYYIATVAATVAAIVAAISATIATIVVVAVAATTSASQSLPRVSLDHGAGELGHAGSTRRSPLLVQPLRIRADAVGLALCSHITSLCGAT